MEANENYVMWWVRSVFSFCCLLTQLNFQFNYIIDAQKSSSWMTTTMMLLKKKFHFVAGNLLYWDVKEEKFNLLKMLLLWIETI